MDFWASLEHKIHYKFEGNAPEHIKKELVECAQMVSELDARMLSLNEQIQANLPVKTECMDLDSAKKSGAIALFDEKYEEYGFYFDLEELDKEDSF